MQQIEVAVAVIHYAHHYLLGFRHAKQHQGNRYEFIGGKLEPGEAPKQALIREVYEEIGLDIANDSQINPLGVLRHEYSEVSEPSQHKAKDDGAVKTVKKVCLHVFRVQLTQAQYEQQRIKTEGCEGQALTWVSLTDLLANRYRLPEANKSILSWLRLADAISITLDIDQIADDLNLDHLNLDELKPANAAYQGNSQLGLDPSALRWVNYYTQYLPKNACVYLRLKKVGLEQQQKIVRQLLNNRSDIQLIIGCQLACLMQVEGQLGAESQLHNQIIGQHLTQAQLTQLLHGLHDSQPHNSHQVHNNQTLKASSVISTSTSTPTSKPKTTSEPIPKQTLPLVDLPITVSCHHEQSIKQVNYLAQYRVNHQLSVVMGIYLSPVKATKTHPERTALGWQQFEQLARLSEVPVIGLGGLAPTDLADARNFGADKVAGIRAFLTK